VLDLRAATLEAHYRAIPQLDRGGSLTATPTALQQKYKSLFLNNNIVFLGLAAASGPSKALI